MQFSPSEVVRLADQGSAPEKRGRLPKGTGALLALLYEASLFEEEGRRVRTAVLLSDSDPRGNLKSVLSSPPALTNDFVRRLGPAADPDDVVLAIQGREQFVVRGLMARWMADLFWNDVLDAAVAVLIEIRGPAHLVVRGPAASVEFHKSSLRLLTAAEDIAKALPAEMFRRSATEVRRRAAKSYSRMSKYYRGFARDYRLGHSDKSVREHVAPLLLDLVKAIRKNGAGGGLLITDAAGGQVPDNLLDSHVGVKPDRVRGRTGDEWSKGLVDFIAITHTHRRTRGAGWRHPGQYEHDFYQTRENMHREVGPLARLCAVDGAVIATPLLRPIALAAKFAVRDRRLPSPVQEFLEARRKGTRHRSMASAVSALDHGAGLVVSADDEATLFLKGRRGQCGFMELIV